MTTFARHGRLPGNGLPRLRFEGEGLMRLIAKVCAERFSVSTDAWWEVMFGCSC
jgi:hypothetical protein